MPISGLKKLHCLGDKPLKTQSESDSGWANFIHIVVHVVKISWANRTTKAKASAGNWPSPKLTSPPSSGSLIPVGGIARASAHSPQPLAIEILKQKQPIK